MSIHAGFAEDFEAFRRRGEIGESVFLNIDPPYPVFGATVSVRAAHLARGRLHADDGRSWPIGDGRDVRLVVDRNMQLHLTNTDGLVLEDIRIEPRAVVPKLLQWHLPESIVTADADWITPRPATEDCDSVTESWCLDEQPWQPLPDHRRIGLPARAGILRLRLELRSRHAPLSPLGIVVVERAIELVCPQPRLVGGSVPSVAPCHEPVAIRLEVQHARQIRLLVDGQEVCHAGSFSRAPVVVAHRFTPVACGTVELALEATDWTGEPGEPIRFTLRVAPRPVHVTVEPLAEDRRVMRLRVKGARPLHLEVPVAGLTLALNAPVVDLEQLGDSATLVRVAVRNDLGHIERHDLSCAAPGMSWQALPQFTALPGFSN